MPATSHASHRSRRITPNKSPEQPQDHPVYPENHRSPPHDHAGNFGDLAATLKPGRPGTGSHTRRFRLSMVGSPNSPDSSLTCPAGNMTQRRCLVSGTNAHLPFQSRSANITVCSLLDIGYRASPYIQQLCCSGRVLLLYYLHTLRERIQID